MTCREPTRARFALIGLAAPLLFAACAGSAWQQATHEDSAVGYHRFLRDHPGSEHGDHARERIAFLELERAPTLEALRRFQARYPSSALLASLGSRHEALEFDAARAAGTARAYEAFVQSFPAGEHASRASGNAVYLRTVATRLDPDVLDRFAALHPESDFAPEARRTADAVARRNKRPISSVGLLVEVAPGVPEARRIEQALTEKAVSDFSFGHVKLVRLAASGDAESAGIDALLIIRHREEAVENVKVPGVLAQPGVLATTRVELLADDRPVFARAFELRVENREHVAGTSVLFGSAGPRFWDDVFFPVATWEVQHAIRRPLDLGANAVAVDATGDRAVVLFRDGSLSVFQLAEPSAPVPLGRMGRKTSFEKFDGVRVLPDGVAIFGEDGVEIFRTPQGSNARIRRLGRGQIGSVSALEPVGDDLIIGSAKGLLWVPRDGDGEIQRLLRPAIRGMARSGEIVVLADADRLFVSTLTSLRAGQVIGQLKIGKSFATRRVRVFGATALVIGDGGVLAVDLRNPRSPRLIARLRPDRVGRIEDAGQVGSRIFLVGERGVQVLGVELDRVAEVVDSVAGVSVAAYGRHLVTVGGSRLQVLDGLPFGSGSAPSTSPAAHRP